MKNLKFRAWNKEDNCMVDDNDVNFIIMQNGDVCLSGSHPDFCGEWFWHVDDNPTDDLIIMQFTGLTDKNGKEIYEGDILKSGGTMVFSNSNVTKGLIRIVEMLPSGFTLVVKNGFELPSIISNISNYTFWNTQRDWTIIGNVYENPELLEL